MRLEIERFAVLMESTLAKHDATKGDSYKETDIHFLARGLSKEFLELDAAIDSCDLWQIQKECIDLANFCMFLERKAYLRANGQSS